MCLSFGLTSSVVLFRLSPISIILQLLSVTNPPPSHLLPNLTYVKCRHYTWSRSWSFMYDTFSEDTFDNKWRSGDFLPRRIVPVLSTDIFLRFVFITIIRALFSIPFEKMNKLNNDKNRKTDILSQCLTKY